MPPRRGCAFGESWFGGSRSRGPCPACDPGQAAEVASGRLPRHRRQRPDWGSGQMLLVRAAWSAHPCFMNRLEVILSQPRGPMRRAPGAPCRAMPSPFSAWGRITRLFRSRRNAPSCSRYRAFPCAASALKNCIAGETKQQRHSRCWFFECVSRTVFVIVYSKCRARECRLQSAQ
jgi:hypothetical protein